MSPATLNFVMGVIATILTSVLSVMAPKAFASGAGETSLGLMQLFSAGVIIAVALTHMLADAGEMLLPYVPRQVVGILFGSAFLLMFIVESSMHNEMSDHGCHPRENLPQHQHHHPQTAHSPAYARHGDAEDHAAHAIHGNHGSHARGTCSHGVETSPLMAAGAAGQRRPESKGTHLSHGPSSVGFLDAAEQSMKLLLALSLHALFEGLGIAAMAERKDFYLLLFAICFHKALAGITIGVYLLKCDEPDAQMRRAVVVFAAATPIGAACGFALAHLDTVFPTAHVFSMAMSGAFVALAAGTLLYVAALEVLPHGITCCREHQALGFSLLLLGFGVMSSLAFMT